MKKNVSWLSFFQKSTETAISDDYQCLPSTHALLLTVLLHLLQHAQVTILGCRRLPRASSTLTKTHDELPHFGHIRPNDNVQVQKRGGNVLETLFAKRHAWTSQLQHLGRKIKPKFDIHDAQPV